MNNKKSFILYLDSFDGFNELNDQQHRQIFEAIIQYQKTQKTELKGLMLNVFTPFKNQFDRDLEAWNKKIKQCSEAGKASHSKHNKAKQRTITDDNGRQRTITDDNVTVTDSVTVTDNKSKACENKFSRDKSKFETFRKNYNGKKRGLETEFKQFKKHKDWKSELTNLVNADVSFAGVEVCFVPMLSTYLNQRRWEVENNQNTVIDRFSPERMK